MSDPNNKVENFQHIQVPDIPEADYGVFEALSEILKKIGRTGQRTSQSVDLIKEDFGNVAQQLQGELEQSRLRQNQIDTDLKSLETGLLDFMDIIDNLHEATTSIDDPAFCHAVDVAVRAKEQINERIGVQQIPGVDSRFDNEVHFVADVQPVDHQQQDGFVMAVIENGYRRGPRLLRKATVVCGKWQGE